MAVITLSGELGSGSDTIARRVAEELGYALADKDTTEAIFRLYGLTRFTDLYGSAPGLLDLLNADNLLLVAMANEITEALARRGRALILGRAGFAVLAGYADALHVFITAPFSERVQRVMAAEGGSDLQAAMDRVRDDDTLHRTYVQRFYNRRWGAPEGYQLVLDTGALTFEAAAHQIVAAARTLERQAPAPSARLAAALTVDPVLADAVERVMAEHG